MDSNPFCGLEQDSCVCWLEDNHNGPHVCECKGSWDFTDAGEFVFVAAPGSGRDFASEFLAMLGFDADE